MSRSKQVFLRVLAPVVILLFLICIWALMRYVSVDDSNSYSRITLHEYYNQDNIDVLFLGASHCVMGFDTEVTDRLLGCNTFNLGSVNQPIDVPLL